MVITFCSMILKATPSFPAIIHYGFRFRFNFLFGGAIGYEINAQVQSLSRYISDDRENIF